MSGSRILVTDATDQRDRPICLPEHVIQIPTGTPWTDVFTLERHQVPPGEMRAFAPHDFLIVERLNAGDEIEYQIAGSRPQKKNLKRASLCLHSAKTELSMKWRKPAETVMIALKSTFVENILAEVFGTSDVELQSPQGFEDQQLQRLVVVLKAEAQEGYPGGRLFSESIATALVLHIIRRYSGLQIDSSEQRDRKLPTASLRRVLDYIHSSLLEDMSLAQLASIAGFSSHHFSALFKQSTGLAPHQYVLHQRVKIAKQLLSDEQSSSLTEIAFKAGFLTHSHLSTAFRKVTGISPSQYRRCNRSTR